MMKNGATQKWALAMNLGGMTGATWGNKHRHRQWQRKMANQAWQASLAGPSVRTYLTEVVAVPDNLRTDSALT